MDGDRLKSLRISKKYRAEDMAELLGVSTRTYQSYERNERDPSTMTLAKLVICFGVSADYLIGIADTPEMRNSLKKEQTRQLPSLFSKKYYALDDFGKGAVNAILDCEYERCTYVEAEELKETKPAIDVESNNTKPEKTYTGIAAAYGGDNRVNQVSEKHLREAADMIWEDEENED